MAACAATGRSRDQFTLTSYRDFTFATSLRVSGVADLLQAADDADGGFRPLHDLADTVKKDVQTFDFQRLRKDGPALLDACDHAKLPH